MFIFETYYKVMMVYVNSDRSLLYRNYLIDERLVRITQLRIRVGVRIGRRVIRIRLGRR